MTLSHDDDAFLSIVLITNNPEMEKFDRFTTFSIQADDILLYL